MRWQVFFASLLSLTMFCNPSFSQGPTPLLEIDRQPELTHGFTFQAKPIEGWSQAIDRVQNLIETESVASTAKFALPTSLSEDAIEAYNRLKSLPPIESFFFPVPETVCFPDDRLQVVDTTSSPYSASCQLVITVKGGGMAIGTGWLISANAVVTAGHCVHEGKNGEFFEQIEVIPGMNGPNRPFGSLTVDSAGLRASAEWQSNGEIENDYGIILLNDSFQSSTGTSPGFFSAEVMTDTQLTSKTVFLSGYPGDKPFGSQWEDSDPVNRVEATRLRYMLDTFGGQSGSAVRVDNVTAIGIHNYGGCPNYCTRITDKVKADLDGWLAE